MAASRLDIEEPENQGRENGKILLETKLKEKFSREKSILKISWYKTKLRKLCLRKRNSYTIYNCYQIPYEKKPKIFISV